MHYDNRVPEEYIHIQGNLDVLPEFPNNKTYTVERSISIGRVCLGNRRHGVLADSTARGQS
jgi:hypothetical protein